MLFGAPLLGQSKPPENGSSKTASLPKINYVSRPVEQRLPAQRLRDPRPPPPVPSAPRPRPPRITIEMDQSRIVTPKDIGRWRSRLSDNKPSRAVREGLFGKVEVELTVGTNGRVYNCAIKEGSGHTILDVAACKGMHRYARFDPALDKSGNPVSANFSHSVVYAEPNKPEQQVIDRARPASPRKQNGWIWKMLAVPYYHNYPERTVEFILKVGTDGRASNCTIVDAAGDEKLGAFTCDLLMEHAEFDPALDSAGNVVVGSYSSSVTYKVN